VATPLEAVVAVCVVLLPSGAVNVKVTPAPEVGEPPLEAVATIGTVPGGVKIVPEMETLTAREGGVTTVALAVSATVAAGLVAVIFTAYVPAGVPDGAPLPIVTEADCPGLSVIEALLNDVDHPDG
jgi:hypothetical protein